MNNRPKSLLPNNRFAAPAVVSRVGYWGGAENEPKFDREMLLESDEGIDVRTKSVVCAVAKTTEATCKEAS